MNLDDLFEKYFQEKPIDRPYSFLQGEMDCLAGVSPAEDANEDYLRGYGSRYVLEQLLGAIK